MRKLLHHTFGCAVFLELRRGDDFGARPVLKFAIGPGTNIRESLDLPGFLFRAARAEVI